ncbi:MAG: mrpB [Clostridiales bacterium]|jgi:multicomponent Na+:H+ antiporter subunit B|nr:mrpB [Clostridiales bacterium]
MNKPFGSIVLDISFRYLVPFILMYGIYVLIHGEYSPGGGFQAGALLAIGIILARLIQGEESSFNISGDTAVILAGLGTLIFAGVGVISLIWSGNVLEYGVFPLNVHKESELHPLGILGIEIGVTICVAAVIIAIYDALTRRDDAI